MHHFPLNLHLFLSSPQHRGSEEGKEKKKSLFAQQFESSGLESFGLVAVSPRTLPVATSVERDKVEPLVLLAKQKGKGGGGGGGGGDEQPRRSKVKEMEGVGPILEAEGDGHGTMEEGWLKITPFPSLPYAGSHLVCAVPLPSALPHTEQHGSASAAAWDRFLFHSSLVSGQGLLTVGASMETASQEVKQIQEENAKKLSALSEEEIVQEQERIKRILGWWMTVHVNAHSDIPGNHNTRVYVVAVTSS